jgi:hypothetical protein
MRAQPQPEITRTPLEALLLQIKSTRPDANVKDYLLKALECVPPFSPFLSFLTDFSLTFAAHRTSLLSKALGRRSRCSERSKRTALGPREMVMRRG